MSFGEEIISSYGNSIQINIGPYKVIALNDPARHHWVLKENYLNYPKGKAYEKMGPLMGQGLLMADYDFWRQNRSIVQPAFRVNRLSDFFNEMKTCCDDLFSGWKGRERLNFHQEMMQFTLSVISKSLFELNLSNESEKISEAIHDFMAGMEEHIFHILPFQKHLPTKVNKKFKTSVKYLNSVVYKIIDERRQSSEGKNDLISLLINASKSGGANGITDKYLRDEIMNFFVGGHETTANAITWCIYNLITHADVQSQVLEEIETNTPGELKFEDLEKYSFLDKVINESLRIYPPIWIISREAKKEDVIDGMLIKKGAIMVVAPYFLHHRQDIWPDSHRFDPERFSENEIEKRPKNSFLPFGLGPRACIGEVVARMEIKTFLILLFKRYSFQLDESVPVIPFATITLRPKNGLYLFIKERT